MKNTRAIDLILYLVPSRYSSPATGASKVSVQNDRQ